jgi:hypothetical protein
MSGNFAVSPLVAGQVPTVLGPLFIADVTSYLKQALFYNESAGQVTFQLYLQPASATAPTPIRQVQLKPQESYELIRGSLTLTPGDALWAQADTANAVDYTITRVDET